MCLLAAEIEAVTSKSPSERYADLTRIHGEPSYRRVDAPATLEQKSTLSKLSANEVSATTLAGESISNIETHASSGGALGGVKVSTQNAWFAARPSGTENVYKIYGESFKGDQHLEQVLSEAQSLVDSVISSR
jgi:phosphoglucomutase